MNDYLNLMQQGIVNGLYGGQVLTATAGQQYMHSIQGQQWFGTSQTVTATPTAEDQPCMGPNARWLDARVSERCAKL